MKRILILLTLISTVTFSKVQCKYVHKDKDMAQQLNVVFKDLLSDKNIRIIEIHFIPFNRHIDECVIVYEDNKINK